MTQNVFTHPTIQSQVIQCSVEDSRQQVPSTDSANLLLDPPISDRKGNESFVNDSY